MVAAGADIVVAHMGVTSAGTIGAHTTMSLDDAVARIQKIGDAARHIRKDIMLLCHGGPIAEPEDAAYVLGRTEGIVGFFGASSAERLPTERAVSDQVKKFKSIQTRAELAPVGDDRAY